MSLKWCLLIPDTHRPYHNVRAYNCMMNAAADIGLAEVLILGDYADFYAVSRYKKNPRIPSMLETEIESVNEGLDEIDEAFPDAKKVFIEGNHELRLETYLIESAPALFGITCCELLFKLDKRPKWSWIPWTPSQQYKVMGTDLYARHRPHASTAKGTASKALVNIVYGDIHRAEEAHTVGLDGKDYVAWCPGWLGDKRKEEIFGYVNGHHQWQTGFGLVASDGKNFYHQSINIKEDNTCVVNGKKYKY